MSIAISSIAQVNVSGTWELVKSESTLNSEFSMAPEKIIIIQESNDLKVEKHSNFQGNPFTTKSKYTLDGKDCVNEGFQGSTIKSNVVVADNKESFTINTKIPMQDGNEMEFIEVYGLTENNLSIKAKASSSWGVIEETWVFKKN